MARRSLGPLGLLAMKQPSQRKHQQRQQQLNDNKAPPRAHQHGGQMLTGTRQATL